MQHGYDTLYGNHVAADLSSFPGSYQKYGSSAAGLYQIMKNTYNWQGVDNLGVHDFSPSTQDMIAVMELQRVGALKPLLTGDISTAVSKSAAIWASLPISETANHSKYTYNGKLSSSPGDPYQPSRSFNSVIRRYNSLLSH